MILDIFEIREFYKTRQLIGRLITTQSEMALKCSTNSSNGSVDFSGNVFDIFTSASALPRFPVKIECKDSVGRIISWKYIFYSNIVSRISQIRVEVEEESVARFSINDCGFDSYGDLIPTQGRTAGDDNTYSINKEWITMNKKYDFELGETRDFLDLYSPMQSLLCKIEIIITDVNDWLPLARGRQEIFISEKIQPGSVIGQLQVQDFDEISSLSFRLLGRENEYFKIESNGNIRVLIQIDREISDYYRLTIEIIDNQEPEGSVISNIIIYLLGNIIYYIQTRLELNQISKIIEKDENDQYPFVDSISNITIRSDQAAGTLLNCLNVNDADKISNLEYKIKNGFEFISIDRFKGCMFLIEMPSTDETEITVTISDGLNQIEKAFYLLCESNRLIKSGISVIQVQNMTNEPFIPNSYVGSIKIKV